MRLLWVAFVIPSFNLLAQTPEDSVRQVVDNFFFAMKGSDTAAMRATLSPAIHLEAAQSIPDAEPSPVLQSMSQFLASVARTPAGALDERIEYEMIKVDGPLASVWTPYRFYFNGRFSHCGVNSFQLVRIKGKWLIHYLIDTRRKNCQSP